MSAPIRTSRRNDLEIRRTSLVDEAIRIIGQHGYNGFTIQQLARQCGLTNGGVLYHFPSKEHLLIAVVDEFTRREGEVISGLIAEDVRQQAIAAPSRGAVLHILRVIVTHSSANPDLARLLAMLQIEALEPGHPAHAQLRQARKRALERYTALLAPISDEPLSLARRVDALMSGLTLQWLCDDQSFDLLTEWDAAIESTLPQTPQRNA
jgi:AcrR family transcriptional regulator